MESLHIEKVIIPYQSEELIAWKSRNPKVVPSYALKWKGPGISNGYGYGEWKAEQYFRQQGFYVFNNDFNLFSSNSKFRRFNHCIQSILGVSDLEVFQRAAKELVEEGISLENPDLFVYNLDTCFFVEVKKGKDRLREPQVNFFHLSKQLLGVDSKLVYLSDKESTVKTDVLKVNINFSVSN